MKMLEGGLKITYTLKAKRLMHVCNLAEVFGTTSLPEDSGPLTGSHPAGRASSPTDGYC